MNEVFTAASFFSRAVCIHNIVPVVSVWVHFFEATLPVVLAKVNDHIKRTKVRNENSFFMMII